MKVKSTKIRIGFIVALVIAVWGALFAPDYVKAQQDYFFPTVYQNTATSVGWTAGTANNGGHAVTIAAGTAAVTLDRQICTAPLFSSCNIVYANSGGTVAVTAASNAITVAMGPGNVPLAFVETSTTAISRIVFPQQASTAVMPSTITVNCGITVTCTSGAGGGYLGTGIIIAYGTAATVAGVAAITGLPFTSSSSYGCVGSLAATTTGTTTGVSCVPASGSTANVTINPAVSGITTPVQFFAIGR